VVAESPAEAPVVVVSKAELPVLRDVLDRALERAPKGARLGVLRALADRVEAAWLRC